MHYATRFDQLWGRYTREAWAATSHDWPGFIAWLLTLRENLRPASWRQYRAAVMSALLQADEEDAEEFIAKLNQPRLEEGDLRKQLPPRTSSSKSKTLPSADLHALADYLHEKSPTWGKLTARWLTYGSLTGLRPTEWQTVHVEFPDTDRPKEDDHLILVVKNAKHDHERAHGAERRVHVYIAQEHWTNFLSFIHDLQAHDYHEAYTGCRIALWRAARALWPRRKKQPTLYSPRHQFAADAKSVGLQPTEIAALMGHSVTETHQAHYGKRRCGRGFVSVEADESDVSRVEQRMQHKANARVNGVEFGAHEG